ncbi:MAG: hypothetical protein ABIH26_07005 [Candidatus Eisenbacteria bacterium]
MKADQLIRSIEIKDRNGRVVGTKEVVTYQGLLSKAHDEGLTGVHTELLQVPAEENGRSAIAKAVVETSKGRFEALGDADPGNVNSIIVPHIIRMAETRAKARALRDAVNVGVVSFEELDGETGFAGNSGSADDRSAALPQDAVSSGNGHRMTEAQRRYLFRILAGRGVHGEDAEEYLKTALDVRALTEAPKAEASALIDRLLNGQPAESGHAHA